MPLFTLTLTVEPVEYPVQADTLEEAQAAAYAELRRDFFSLPEEWDDVNVRNAYRQDAKPYVVVDGGRFAYPGCELRVPNNIPEEHRKAYVSAYRNGMEWPVEKLETYISTEPVLAVSYTHLTLPTKRIV